MGPSSTYQDVNARELTFFQNFVSRSNFLFWEKKDCNCLANMLSYSNVVLEQFLQCKLFPNCWSFGPFEEKKTKKIMIFPIFGFFKNLVSPRKKYDFSKSAGNEFASPLGILETQSARNTVILTYLNTLCYKSQKFLDFINIFRLPNFQNPKNLQHVIFSQMRTSQKFLNGFRLFVT